MKYFCLPGGVLLQFLTARKASSSRGWVQAVFVGAGCGGERCCRYHGTDQKPPPGFVNFSANCFVYLIAFAFDFSLGSLGLST